MTEPTLNDLKRRNQQLLEDMSTHGFSIDENVMLKLRVDLLTELLVAAEMVDADDLELRWETLMGDLLSAASSEVQRRILAQQ